MEAKARLQRNHLKQLFHNPHQYEFLQAVRLLVREFAEQNNCCLNESLANLTFSSNPYQQFPPAPIHRLELKNGRVNLEQSFFSLAGINGVLPAHFSELLLQRMEAKDYSLKDFLDLFNDRITKLFYKCWQQSQFFVNYELNQQASSDKTLSLLLALTGQSKNGFREDTISTDSLIYYSGLFSQQQRHHQGLKLILQDFFNLPIAIHQFCGEWIKLDEDSQTALGCEQHYSQLAVNTMIGSRIWHVQNHFEVAIGPLNYQQFHDLLPIGDMLPALKAMVKFYCGIEYQFTTRLLLCWKSVPYCQLRLKKSLRLGWNTWLRTKSVLRKNVSVKIQ